MEKLWFVKKDACKLHSINYIPTTSQVCPGKQELGVVSISKYVLEKYFHHSVKTSLRNCHLNKCQKQLNNTILLDAY